MGYKIYYIENLVNKKVYVGYTNKTIEERFAIHIKNAKQKINRRLYNSMNYHGYDKFVINQLDENETNDGIRELEKWYIHLLKSDQEEFGYNMTKGGDGGYTLGNWTVAERQELYKKQQESRETNNLKKYGVNHPNTLLEIRKKLSTSAKKRILSEETKEKIRKTLIRKGIKPPTQYWTDIPNPRIGIPHTEESKRKIGLSREGKPYDELFGIEKSNELKEKRKNNMKGSRNPMYIEDYDLDEKISILYEIKYNKKIDDISKNHKTSPYKIRQFLKKLGINNIQTFRRNTDFRIIMENIILNLNYNGK